MSSYCLSFNLRLNANTNFNNDGLTLQFIKYTRLYNSSVVQIVRPLEQGEQAEDIEICLSHKVVLLNIVAYMD